MKPLITNIKKNEVINSYNLARRCNIVYSEVISQENFKLLNLRNYTIIHQDQSKIFYKLNSLSIKENDVIFCNTFMIGSLFKLLKNIDLRNIKLVTHQTDLSITKDTFNQKPDCISEWYSINVDYDHKNLFSLPIGLSNEYSPKNLFQKNYKDSDFINFENKIKKGYANFQINTNNKVREATQRQLIKSDWVVFDEPNLEIDEYLSKLIKYKYILAPFGNGIDTHRIWESLYAGSIPVVQKHINFASYSDLPICFIDDFGTTDIKFLEDFSKNIVLDNFNSNKLKVTFWEEAIKAKNIEQNKNLFQLQETSKDEKYFINEYLRKERNKSRLKRIYYNFRRVRNRIKKLLSLLN
jgi:hypothetical protein